MDFAFHNDEKAANEIIYFNDGRMTLVKDSLEYHIIKKIFLAFLVVLAAGSIIFKEFLLAGESISVWVCLFLVVCYLLKNGKYERIECPSQLQFYDDYLVFYVPKYRVNYKKERMEVKKIYYHDVEECEFRTNTRKMCICGMMDEAYYEYDKQGVIEETPSFKKHYEGMIYFYTVFDNEHDFKEIIERNSPLKVEYQTI